MRTQLLLVLTLTSIVVQGCSYYGGVSACEPEPWETTEGFVAPYVFSAEQQSTIWIENCPTEFNYDALGEDNNPDQYVRYRPFGYNAAVLDAELTAGRKTAGPDACVYQVWSCPMEE